MFIFKHLSTATVLAAVTIADLIVQSAAGQSAPGKVEFEVASVKPNKSDAPPSSNNPLGPGNVYSPYGGFFQAANFPLYTYIGFAYKIMGNQEQFLRPQMPAWVMTDRFDIQGRADGNPDKDRMRLMMRSLLADRFKLAIHYETRQVPVFALVLLKPGKTGPALQPHAPLDPTNDSSCPTVPQVSQNQVSQNQVAGQFPALCGGLFPLPPTTPGRVRFGARNVTLGFIANQVSAMGQLERPVIDRTGLDGNFDFALEWVLESRAPQAPGADLPTDSSGPTFLEALKDQLGIKLESQKGPAEVIILDHVEHPSEN
jgi:uncharacterized protein (TIGR03435 family)